MYARGTGLMLRCAALLALLLLASPARAQWDARPPGRLAALTSGPAAVSLVATLESLSVSASPSVLSESVSDGAARQSLTVTTAWTIPANCTTLRLTGYSTGLTTFARDPLSAPAAGASGGLVLRARAGVSENETDWPAIAQPVGPTSYPGSRTDSIQLGIDPDDNASPGVPSSPVFILAQAL
ncbi:MAG: hypothetical protein WA294_14935 [Acidobacteriaceae bacterium]